MSQLRPRPIRIHQYKKLIEISRRKIFIRISNVTILCHRNLPEVSISKITFFIFLDDMISYDYSRGYLFLNQQKRLRDN